MILKSYILEKLKYSTNYIVLTISAMIPKSHFNNPYVCAKVVNRVLSAMLRKENTLLTSGHIIGENSSIPIAMRAWP